MDTVGTGFTMTAMVRATDPPPESFTHAFTEYVPAAAYEWLGVATVLVIPSPKDHANVVGPAAFVVLAVKVTGLPESTTARSELDVTVSGEDSGARKSHESVWNVPSSTA